MRGAQKYQTFAMSRFLMGRRVHVKWRETENSGEIVSKRRQFFTFTFDLLLLLSRGIILPL